MVALIIGILIKSGSFPEINECSSSPCQHNATCTDAVNGFICNCSTAYTGVQCETGQWKPTLVKLETCTIWGEELCVSLVVFAEPKSSQVSLEDDTIACRRIGTDTIFAMII